MFLNQVPNDHYRNYRGWLGIINMRAHSMVDRIRLLRGAHNFFPDAPFSDDVFVSVDRGSGQMIRFSEKDLVDKYIKYDELCKEQFYLLPQLNIDLEEVDPNAGRGVTPKPVIALPLIISFVQSQNLSTYALSRLSKSDGKWTVLTELPGIPKARHYLLFTPAARDPPQGPFS